MLISGGENLCCAEVENVLAEHPDVVEAAIIGRPDERWGQTPVAVLVLRTGSSLTLAELVSFCREHLAGYEVPRDMVVLDMVVLEALPCNASGKLVKPELRARHGGCGDREVDVGGFSCTVANSSPPRGCP